MQLVTYDDNYFLVAWEQDATKASGLTQVVIGFIVLVSLIILIVVLVKTYQKQQGKYKVEKRLQQQATPTVDTSTFAVTPNSSSVNWIPLDTKFIQSKHIELIKHIADKRDDFIVICILCPYEK